MCWVMPPASPDWTFALRIRSRRLVLPWSTCPITVTTGGFSTRSSELSSGTTSAGAGSSTAPISTSTPSSSAMSSISSVERVWVSVFISPRPMRTLMIWVGGTPRASPRSLTVAPGSTRTPPPASCGFSSTGARSVSLGAAGATVWRGARLVALASMTTRRRFLSFFLGGSETGSSAGAAATVAPWPERSASARASRASDSCASERPFAPKTRSYTGSSTDEEWLLTSTPASRRRLMTSLLSRSSSLAISYTRLLIRYPLRPLDHAFELRGLLLVRRDAAEEGAGQRHVRAPPAVGEDRAAAMHRRVLVGLPVLFLVLELDCLALGLYVYFPVCQLDGEAGVLPLATDKQRELVVGHDHPGLPFVLVQVDLAHARGAESLRDKACGLGVPLDDVYLLVPELGDDRPHAAPPRADARPDRVDPRLLRPHPDLRAQPRLAGHGLDLDEPVVDLRNL